MITETALQSAPAPREHVMVVDDDDLLRRTLTVMLEASGFEVDATEDAGAAESAIERGDVDCLILDVIMPKVNGLDVCRRIKSSAQGRRVPVILLTAQGGPEDVISGLDAGADDFLKKPIEPSELGARVRAILRYTQAHRQAEGANAAPSLPELLAVKVHELADKSRLSKREREVLDLLLLGRSMDEIAVALDISPRTAKFHQANLLHKIGAESRLELLRLLM